MKSILLFSLMTISSISAWATHIVGGELSLQYTNQGNRYRLSLNLYFDDINGEREAEDNQIFVAMFSKRTNRRIDFFTLPRTGYAQVPYTNVVCTSDRLQTRKIHYNTEVTLDPNVYTEAEGYYFTWERCCRNETIVNITNPGDNGMVFYMEFPALSQNGNRFVNSTPEFTMPKGDYVCVNEPFLFDFSATDVDGDELKYSIVTPSRGNSEPRNTPFGSGPHPGARGIFYPAPYPEVNWAPGFNLVNVMGGSVPLRVNASTGQISFTTNRLGLYVFSVLCEEYRNGVKIGAVQRDFQLLVIDYPKNDPPTVQVRKEGETAVYQPGQILNLFYSGSLCFSVLVSDPDINSTVQLQVNALNFSTSAMSVSPLQGRLTTPADTLQVQVCFTDCIPHTPDEPLLLEVIASDNGCPVPKQDTMLVTVYIEPVPTASPEVVTTLSNNTSILQIGQTIAFDVIASDPDQDVIKLYAIGRGFSLPEAGMEFISSSGTGQLTQPFVWTPSCEALQNATTFTIDFITEDNSCSSNRFDTVTVLLQVENFEVVMSRFVPPNVFTPNHDGVNDFFEIPNLPSDNCDHIFRSIEVYNRWGRPVYSAQVREFQWSGVGFPTGMYFYLIDYGASTYKGTVSLLR